MLLILTGFFQVLETEFNFSLSSSSVLFYVARITSKVTENQGDKSNYFSLDKKVHGYIYS